MAIAMIVCTVAAWTPYAVVSLMVSIGYEQYLGPVSTVSPAIFAKTSVIYNPIVYYFFNNQVRLSIFLIKINKSAQMNTQNQRFLSYSLL